MERRIVSGRADAAEAAIEEGLRPRTLREFCGQAKVKELLDIYIAAASERREALDHVLLYGPPGLGKTTLAHVVANELGVNIRVTSGPAIERPGDLAALLTNLEERDILFIDEIHRLSRSVEEILYPAMEDFALDIIIGKGPGARSVRLPLPRFTLVGATTRAGMLTSPLRDRFGVILKLDFYGEDELRAIVGRAARLLGLKIDGAGAGEVARRARGTPRVANRLLRRLRDIAQVRGENCITRQVASAGLAMLEVDELGLEETDKRLLQAIITRYGGGPVGLETLAAATSEEPETIEDVYEPFLMQAGFLQRTPRGRVATPAAYAHLGIPLGGAAADGRPQPGAGGAPGEEGRQVRLI